jgi:hypothetical protein
LSERTPLASRLQALAHVIAIIVGWCLFFWFWWRVAGQPWDSRDLRLLVIAAAVGFPLVTGAWILHNRGIYKRRGPRRAIPPGPMLYEADFNGRQVDSDWAALRAERQIEIALDGSVKRYRAAPRAG